MMKVENWVSLPEYEGAYEVSSHGRVRGIDRLVKTRWGGTTLWRGKILKPSKDPDGYLRLTLTARGVPITKKVSHLVALAFIGPRPDGMQVCHKDGIRTNNFYKNLRYDTFTGNIADKAIHGTQNIGEKNGRAKLSMDDVRLIKKMLPYLTRKDISQKFGVTTQTIGTIARGESWK